MRWIQKRNEPCELTEWRVRYAKDINFGYELMRKDQPAINAVTDLLVAEQGWLCAYSGMPIEGYKEVEKNGKKYYKCSCHIDHVKAQDHCTPYETVTYSNMVACYPGPNTERELPYGGHKKRNWPDYTKGEQTLFVSPLDQSCESRFLFNLRGEIKHNEGDNAAETTINKLGLDHEELRKLRKAAIQGTLGLNNNLLLQDARSRLTKLQSRQTGRLEPFCFVLIQALKIHIKRLEKIAKYKPKNNKK